jgi:hypothetical protein
MYVQNASNEGVYKITIQWHVSRRVLSCGFDWHWHILKARKLPGHTNRTARAYLCPAYVCFVCALYKWIYILHNYNDWKRATPAQKFKYKHTLVFRTRRLVQTIIDATPQLLIPLGDAVNYFYRPQPFASAGEALLFAGRSGSLGFYGGGCR